MRLPQHFINLLEIEYSTYILSKSNLLSLKNYDTVPENNPAGPVKLLFENANDYIINSKLHNQEKGNLFLISDQIDKYIDRKEKQEKYTLNCEELSNNGIYYFIQGKIRYQDWLDVDEKDLTKQNFIIQSNNVVYWSQTFEFVSEMICAAD